MKLKTVLALGILVSMTACKKETPQSETKSSTEPEKKETSTTVYDSATITNAYIAYGTPGKAHEMMAKDVGLWEEELTFWQKPNGKAMNAKASVEIKMIMDGKFQEMTHRGDLFGTPFEGKSTLAYDNVEKKYTSTWIDNMSSGFLIMKGNYDEASKTFKMEGDCYDPVTKKSKKMKETLTIIDENTQKMEMYDTYFDGTEFKSMEILMKRKK